MAASRKGTTASRRTAGSSRGRNNHAKPGHRGKGVSARPRGHQPSRGVKPSLTTFLLKLLIAGTVVIVAALALIASLHAAKVTEPAPAPALHLIEQLSTAEDSTVVLGAAQRAELVAAGRAHRQVQVTQVDGSGKIVSDRLVDLTPRIDPANPNSAVLQVAARANAVINSEVDTLVRGMNSPSPVPGRALYPGLLATNFQPGVKVMIIASAMDTVDPLDARKLDFQVPTAQVLNAVGELPSLQNSDVEFLIKSTAGTQPQLRGVQKQYLRSLWSSLLLAGHARSVTFVDLPMAEPDTAKVTAPIVPVPALPGTPIKVTVDPARPHVVQCQLSASTYFQPNSAQLIDVGQTIRDLQPCVSRIGPSATVQLDGWTAYFGPLTGSGQPAVNPPADVELSRQRTVTVAKLLERMGIASSRIGRLTGHGNSDQPYPADPSSDQNRTVRITSELKDAS